ncbi:hypothetical protein BX666DRAFT_55879 [Dichotomocladium elegans]|nr:hypothetical protein BX666DRAFT_55879 [Dichotomocladium elegans]
MPFTPYTSQTILQSANGVIEQTTTTPPQQPASFFSRRPPASPPDAQKPLPSSPPSRFNVLLSGQSSGTTTATTQFTIDAVEAWDTNLYLGTSDGSVLHLILEEHTKPGAICLSSRKQNQPRFR